MTILKIGCIAIPLALLGGATLASAQTTTTTTTVETRRDPITLTPQQRTVIYRTVRRGPAVAMPPNVVIQRGAVVPPAVVLQPLPQTVYTDIPQLPQYRYFYVNNRLVLVDPATSQVVDIIDE